MSKVEVFQDVAGEWRFRVKARNNTIVAQGESHPRRRDAVRSARALRRLMSNGVVLTVNGEQVPW